MDPVRRLLVVDDVRVDRAIAMHWGQKAGFETWGAAGVSEAEALFADGERFDCVLLDLTLGEEDGLKLLPTLALHNGGALLVFCSGCDSRVLASSQRLAARLGLHVAGVLKKPLHPQALRAILEGGPGHAVFAGAAGQLVDPDDLRQAFTAGAVVPWFQPKTSLITGGLVGAEALARWIPDFGRPIPPADFVEVAERNGMSGLLTDLIIDQSLRACARWRRSRPELTVAVNVSPLLLNDPDLTRRIERLLRAHDVPPDKLVVEITEGRAIPDTARAVEILTRLRIWGVNLAVDDFGTGHSSLLALARMPFNELKIDKAFVSSAASNAESLKIVTAVASLGRGLGLKVIAEGVETAEVATLLRDTGCHIGQGWLYGRAASPAAFEALVGAACSTPAEPVG